MAMTPRTKKIIRLALLMTLGGSHSQVEPRGTALVAVHFDSQGNPTGYEFLIPSDFYFRQFTLQQMNFRLSGFGTRFIDYDNDGWRDLFIVKSGTVPLIGRCRRFGVPQSDFG